MHQVLLVEDDLDLAETVIEFLLLDQITCDHCANGKAALTLMASHRYDVLLLDLNLPRLDGLSVCEQLRSKGDDTPVLMLTARDQITDKIDGFKAGTDDYLVKPFELQELVVRINALARRRSGQATRLCFGELEMNLTSHITSRNGQLLKLSPTGWKLLECLLRAAPDPVSRQRLEQQVWGDDVPDSNALKVHMHHLRKAVDGPFDHAILKTVQGLGFVLAEST